MKNSAKVVLTAVAAAGVAAGSAGAAAAQGTGAQAAAVGSPGVLSGNVVQIPIDIPVNLCGNTVNGLGALNPAIGNTCVNARTSSTSVHYVHSAHYRG